MKFTDYILCFLIIGFILFGLLFVAKYGITKINEKTCEAEAMAMKFNYEFYWNWIAKSQCVYILPDGKRIISSQYRIVE